MYRLFLRLWKGLDKYRKFQVLSLTVLMVICAFAELLTISAVVPFISILVTPDLIIENSYISYFSDVFNLTSIADIRNGITIIFITLVIIAALLRFFLLYFQTRLSFEIGADFARSMYFKTLSQSYLVHVGRNSSEIVSTVVLKANALSTSALLPLLTLISSAVILLFILAGIIIVDPAVSIVVFTSFLSAYLIISFFTKKRLDVDSSDVNFKLDGLMKSLQEGLGGIRDIIIDNLQKIYAKNFEKSHYGFRRAAGNIHIIASGPKYAIEAIGMIVIVGIALSMINSNSESMVDGIPTLAVFALGAQKLFPILQGMFASIATLRGSKDSMYAVFNLYDQTIPVAHSNNETIKFEKQIVFKDVTFRYSDGQPNVLSDIAIDFSKGEKIGIIGETGSGKSTFLDILMGLIIPTQGNLYVDDKKINNDNFSSWHKHISHVPQSIYLIDATIAENIAFGLNLSDIDIEKVKDAAKKAQISETIESLDEQYFTKVGERGIRLSGGQIQRIGLARALYKDTDVIILDEATSALDNSTETKVMNAIDKLNNDLTIFIVAHRHSTLKNCNKIIKIESGRATTFNSYQEILD